MPHDRIFFQKNKEEERKEEKTMTHLAYKTRMVIYVYSQLKFLMLIVLVLKLGRLYSPLKLLD